MRQKMYLLFYASLIMMLCDFVAGCSSDNDDWYENEEFTTWSKKRMTRTIENTPIFSRNIRFNATFLRPDIDTLDSSGVNVHISYYGNSSDDALITSYNYDLFSDMSVVRKYFECHGKDLYINIRLKASYNRGTQPNIYFADIQKHVHM